MSQQQGVAKLVAGGGITALPLCVTGTVPGYDSCRESDRPALFSPRFVQVIRATARSWPGETIIVGGR
jgi:hypothetical protein